VAFEPTSAAQLLALASAFLLGIGVLASRRRPAVAVAGGLVALALLLASALCAALAVSVHGYRALTREEVAAVVEIEPLARPRFVARVALADGRSRSFELMGDELYVDARVLKWSPWANLLGLHTSYALDRIGGRYADLEAERREPRTVHSLVDGAPLDAFVLRRKHDLLAPLLDASYGSATFTPAGRRSTIEVRVSTTGLLVRERPGDARPALGSGSRQPASSASRPR
jgi:hypothetical protein